MESDQDISLLIKSRYPLIYIETVDEDYSLARLREAASVSGLAIYRWSMSGGLRRGENKNSIYQTNEPAGMLKNILQIIQSPSREPVLLILKDLNKHLDNPVILRACKDLIKQINNTRDTVIILSYEYSLPKDLALSAAHIVCGYPREKEIGRILHQTITELPGWHRQVKISLDFREEKQVVRALQGLTEQQIRNVLHQTALENNTLCIKDLSAIENYKRKIYDKEGILEFYAAEDATIIAGFYNLKLWLQDRQGSFDAHCKFNLPPPKGLLLMGVQGCGKSLSARVIARELALPLYRLDMGKLYSSYIGQTEENLRRALTTVERLSPLCLWIDEIEKGITVSDSRADGGVSKRVLGAFLTWMQERKENCFIIATANDVQALPPELMRKGRMDEIFFVDLPDHDTRVELFKIHLARRNLQPDLFALTSLAAETEGFSGAEIEQAVISALYRANRQQHEVNTEHIKEQIKSTRPLSVIKREEIEALRYWAKDRTVPV